VREKKAGIRKVKLFFFLTVFLTGLAGCAGNAVNPYNSEFSCPQMEKGKCVGISQAYADSLKQEKEEEIENYYPSLEEKPLAENKALQSEEKYIYADALFKKLTKILKEPETPMLTVPHVVRVLILPYRSNDGKTLYFSRYVYVITDEPRWVLDNLLTGESSEGEK